MLTRNDHVRTTCGLRDDRMLGAFRFINAQSGLNAAGYDYLDVQAGEEGAQAAVQDKGSAQTGAAAAPSITQPSARDMWC